MPSPHRMCHRIAELKVTNVLRLGRTRTFGSGSLQYPVLHGWVADSASV